LDRLIAEGRVARPARAGLPRPLALEGDPQALSRATRCAPSADVAVFYLDSSAIRRAVATDQRLEAPPLLEQAAAVLDAIALRPVDRVSFAAAGAIDEPALRSLDALHLVAAIDLSPLHAFVTYDERQAAVARLAGLRTLAPGA
jgi:predicted nucleic acid-binding protein